MFQNISIYGAVTAVLSMTASTVSANEGFYFNPAFLGDDPSLIADLSRFENGAENLPGHYRVDVYVNGNGVGARELEFRAVSDAGDLYPCLNVDMLEEFNVDLSALANIDLSDSCLNLPDIIVNAKTTPSLDKLRLDISLPQASLRPEFRGYIPPERWDNGITAAYANYQFSSNTSLRGSGANSRYINLQAGINIGPWQLRDVSTYSDYSGQRQVSHISTELRRTFPSITSAFTLGDTYSSGQMFDTVRLRGIKLETDPSMRPQNLQGFAPSVRGIAKTSARVVIRQNGYEIYQANVQPGPFELLDFYPASSSGDLQVTIEEDDGRKETFVVPYSTVPALQREGQASYSFSLGHLDGGLSQRQADVVQGELKWGLPAGITLYGGVQMSNDYHAYAVGGGLNLGTFGALSGDITDATARLADGRKETGQSVRFLYAKSLNNYGTHFQLVGYRYSTKGFYSLSESSWETESVGDRYAKKGQAQVSINQRVGDLASLYVSGSRQTFWGRNEVDQSMQLGLNGSVKSVSWGVAYSQSNSALGGNDRSVAINISMPLMSPDIHERQMGNTMSANLSLGTTVERDGSSRHNAYLGGTLMDDARLSYGLSQSYDTKGHGKAADASLGYSGTYGDARIGVSHSAASQLLRTDFSGGLLVHDSGITLGPRLGETNILVDTGGVPGVGIDGYTGVKTDAFGHALVTSASAYRENRVSLDTRTFSDETEAEETVNKVIPNRGAIVKTSFAMRTGKKAIITLTRDGEPLPFGTAVVLQGEEDAYLPSGIVGDEGQVFMSGLPQSGVLVARWGEGAAASCEAIYDIPPRSDSLSQFSASCVIKS